MATIRLTLSPSGRVIEAAEGVTVYDALLRAGVPFDAPCGGRGVCGRCRVVASGGLDEPGPQERRTLGALLEQGWRLACVARLAGDATVELADETAQAASEGGPRPGSLRLGLAVDLGTTSIAVALVDLSDGSTLAGAALLNPQAAHGADVLSRVSHAADPGGLAELSELARRGVEACAAAAALKAGVGVDRVSHVAVAGNTVMLHLFAAEDPSGLGTAPYRPAFLERRTLPAGTLPAMPQADVELLPGAAAFLGADAIAGALSTRVASPGMGASAGSAVYVDVGTNGEIVLSAGGRLFGASAAAGPAFEGVGTSFGMRAVNGAIDRADLAGGDLSVHVIGGGSPVGLCGTGALDVLAAARRARVLDTSGRMLESQPGPMGARVREGEHGLELFVAEGAGQPVTVTQLDVRALQLAKGAVAAAIELLLGRAGLPASDVTRIVLAGAFGAGLRPATATELGLLPSAWTGRFESAGNAALKGAIAALSRPGFADSADAVAAAVETIDLAADLAFNDTFMRALALEPFEGPRGAV